MQQNNTLRLRRHLCLPNPDILHETQPVAVNRTLMDEMSDSVSQQPEADRPVEISELRWRLRPMACSGVEDLAGSPFAFF